VLTLTATNVSGITGTITVIASDGAGGFATNTFTATTKTDTNDNGQPFLFPNNTVTNLVAPINTTLTNFISAIELAGDELSWDGSLADAISKANGTNSSYNQLVNTYKTLTYNVTNAYGKLQLFIEPATNYVGHLSVIMYPYLASDSDYYSQEEYTFVFGDTPISARTNTVNALASVPFANELLAVFTNGVAYGASTNFTAFINWGDDTTNSGVVTANAAGQKAVLGSHNYACPGNYPVYVQIQSAIGAAATVLSFVNVTNQDAPATNLLTVQVTGQGTVSPDYTDAPLAVGGGYSITASPANGWVLTSWTDENGYVLGTGTNLTFTMSPGLSLTANFDNAMEPLLSFVSPSSGGVVTNLYSAPAIITGTAAIVGTMADVAAVAGVFYQVNSGGWLTATGTTNWSASFMPDYGITNVIQAFAINGFGYPSTTNTLLVKYRAGAVLTLTTDGLGSITPNLNGDLLPLGSNYVLTATAGHGFTFAGWTGGWTTNRAALSFTMATNSSFTANFTDNTRPTVEITNLVSGQTVGANGFVVRGTAGDNWQLAGVEYQLNGAGWTPAASTNQGTNWSATLNLISGTNVFQVSAVDGTGTRSATNTATVDLVALTPLQLFTNGLGAITPYYSNAWLQVGRSYTLTAAPASGFSFVNWTGSLTTNKAALTFIMASNLSLTANFKDAIPPTLSITNLVSGQPVCTNVFTVQGAAGDNWQLTGVNYQINGAGWTNATNWPAALALTTNHWSATLALNAGTNLFQAYSCDSTGLHSKTNTVTLDNVVLAPLQLFTNGLGTITPYYSNAWLQVGRNYTLTAVPAAGFGFVNWTGSVTNTKAALSFTMESNLSFTASFTDQTKPAITVTNLVNGQLVSTSLFTVCGTAKDSNWRVAGVMCQLNSNGWLTATGSTNWSAALALTTGTNWFQAYACDPNGTPSATNTLAVDKIILAPLQLFTNGLGTITPYYSNAWLQVDRSYTLTAVPATGWLFNDWMICSPTLNAGLATLTNRAALTFTMSSNLELTANFYQPPAIQTQPASVSAFYGGAAGFSVAATGSGSLACQWQHNATNLAGQTATTLDLTGLTTNQAGSYRVIVSEYSSSVTSSVANLTLTATPTSLAGLAAIVTPADRSSFQISFGTNTFSQFSTDTNYDDSAVGTYEYALEGVFPGVNPLTAQLSLTNQQPPDAVSNATQVIDLTFVTPGWAVFTNGDSSGTIQYYTATNLVPKTWSGHKLVLTSTGQTNTLNLTSANEFATTNSGISYTCPYTAAAYSPVAAWFQSDSSFDVTLASPGGVGFIVYLQLQFTATTNGNYILENYEPSLNPGAQPEFISVQQGGFIWK
jgi:hypothetical protein